MLGVEGHEIPVIAALGVVRVVRVAVLLLLAHERPLLIELDLAGRRGKKPRTRHERRGSDRRPSGPGGRRCRDGPDQACGGADATSFLEMAEDRHNRLVGELGPEEDGPFVLREGVLADVAAEESVLAMLAEAVVNREVSGVASADSEHWVSGQRNAEIVHRHEASWVKNRSRLAYPRMGRGAMLRQSIFSRTPPKFDDQEIFFVCVKPENQVELQHTFLRSGDVERVGAVAMFHPEGGPPDNSDAVSHLSLLSATGKRFPGRQSTGSIRNTALRSSRTIPSLATSSSSGRRIGRRHTCSSCPQGHRVTFS